MEELICLELADCLTVSTKVDTILSRTKISNTFNNTELIVMPWWLLVKRESFPTPLDGANTSQF